MMNEHLKFECFFNKQPAYLQIDQNHLEVKTQNENLKFYISLNLHFQWIYIESQINEVKFQNHNLKASRENLQQLKNLLDCRVMYLGAAEIYEQCITIKEDKCKKVMILKSILNGKKYFCKAYKKEIVENEFKFLNEIKILRILKDNKNVLKILEVYESQHNYYMIMENLKNQIEQNYTHEENLIILIEILKILEDLNNKFIIHGQIRPRNFMFDQDNMIKLIGFSKAKQLEYQDETDIFDLHKIVLYLNGFNKKDIDIGNGIYPSIPSHGTNFLKSLVNCSQYRMNIKQALSHPFLRCGETDHQIAKEEMNLKFKYSFNSQL